MDQGPNTFSQMTGIWKLIRATSAVGLAMSSLGKPCYGMFCPKSILHYLTSSYIICAFICSYDCDWLPSSRGWGSFNLLKFYPFLSKLFLDFPIPQMKPPCKIPLHSFLFHHSNHWFHGHPPTMMIIMKQLRRKGFEQSRSLSRRKWRIRGCWNGWVECPYAQVDHDHQ